MMIYRSESRKIHRPHVSKETRWMHDPDEIIPTREPESLNLKEWLQAMGITAALTALMFLVWWFRG